MNVALRSTMTLEQFLAWEERQEPRYEFDGVQPVALTGGTEAHDDIQINLVTALRTRLRGQRCRVHGSNLKVIVAGRARYPDAFITCTPAQARSTIATEPVVVFEILSDTTAYVDLTIKNEEYRATPSIQRYVVLQQTHASALVFNRKSHGWLSEIVHAGGVLRLPEADLEVPLDELYLDVALAGAPAEDNEPSPSVR